MRQYIVDGPFQLAIANSQFSPTLLQELYRLLHLCAGEHVVGKWKDFRAKYVKPIEAARQRSADKYALERGQKVLKELKEMIQPYLLKRQRKDHLSGQVPPNFEFDVWTKISPKSRQLYSSYLQSDNKNVQGVASGDTKCALPVIGELRMLCGHPLMEYKGGVHSQFDALGVDKVIAMSPKVQLVADMVQKWTGEGSRILVFAHYSEILDILEFVFSNLEGIDACRIDGKTSMNKLEFLVNDFNGEESMFNVMLLSIDKGGEGLTLTGANKCIVFDPVWTQAKADQAVARISRPGQTRECESVFLIAAGTIEEKVNHYCLRFIFNVKLANVVLSHSYYIPLSFQQHRCLESKSIRVAWTAPSWARLPEATATAMATVAVAQTLLACGIRMSSVKSLSLLPRALVKPLIG